MPSRFGGVKRLGTMRTVRSVSLLYYLLALGVAPGQQKQPLAQHRTVDDLARAVRSGDVLALAQLRALGDKGDVIAQFNLGVIYESGDGVPKDHELAAQWYLKAAEQGDADAEYQMGWMNEAGEGVPKNAALAAQWYRKASEQGSADAEFSLGSMFREGRGVPKDLAVAAQWYRKAAEQGDAVAQATLDRVTEGQIVLRKAYGVLLVPVTINDKITLDFVLDSGAAEVSVPADVILTLMRTGTLTAQDFTGARTYVLADGSTVPSQTFRIRSLKIGDWSLENVSGSVSSVEGSLLLGQSFLSRFKSWTVDNVRQVLTLQMSFNSR
jgi:predicted aspartyl protease